MLAAVVLAGLLGGGGVAVTGLTPAATGETVEAASPGRQAGGDATHDGSRSHRTSATGDEPTAAEHAGAAIVDGGAADRAAAGSGDAAAVPTAGVAAPGASAVPSAQPAPASAPAAAPPARAGEAPPSPPPAPAAAAPAPPPPPPPPPSPAKPSLPTGALRNPDAQRSWQLVNELRAELGLGAVQLTADAIDKAQALADKMAAEGALSHSTSLDAGLDGRWSVVVENVGYGASVDEVHRLLMADPPHLHHMIDPRGAAGGIGAARGADGAVYIAQIFVG